MDNDVTAYRMAIGLFYCRSCLVSKKCLFKSLRLLPHYFFSFNCTSENNSNLAIYVESYFERSIRTKPIIHFFLLQLLLLSIDVAENPGPDNKVSDLTVFHCNARRLRNKIT